MNVLENTRVAILVQNLPVPFDRRVWQESLSLSGAGASVTVICTSDDQHPAGEFEIEGIRVVRYLAPREASGPVGYIREYGLAIWRMRRALLKERAAKPFDVVHFCNPPDLLYLVARVLKSRDETVLIFDQHDLGPELVEAKHMPFASLFVKIARHFEKKTYLAADHIISTNKSYKEIAMTRGGFSAEDITIVRSAPSRSWPNDDFDRRDWHKGRDKLIGYVGVMGRQEGIELLLESIPRLVEIHSIDVQLALIGSGPDRARLQARVIELGIQDRVDFYGRVPDDQMKSILTDADVCVNPDEVNKMNNLSTMNKIIEYMALGKPIVQFDVLEGRYSALESSLYAASNDVADFASKIAEVLEDSELADRLGSAGRLRFDSELCWDIQGQLLVQAYQRILHLHPRAQAH